MKAPLALSVFAIAGLAASSQAAVISVHTTGRPTGLTIETKLASNYYYLEGETAASGASDTMPADDVGHTYYRTSSNPATGWSNQNAYDNTHFAAYGADTASFSNFQLTWEDLPIGVVAGTYNVYVRGFAGSNGSETFSFASADSLANIAGGASTGSAATTSKGAVTWVSLGTITLAADTDTFRLNISTTLSAARVDTVLLVSTEPAAAVPEAASLSLLGLGALTLLARKR